MEIKSNLLATSLLLANPATAEEENRVFSCDANHPLCPAITQCMEETKQGYDACVHDAVRNIKMCPWNSSHVPS